MLRYGNNRIAIAVLVVLVVLVPWWPLAVMVVAFAALSGSFLFAIIFALATDIVWGQPAGVLQYLYFPLAFLALALALARALGGRYLFDRRLPKKLY